jgi:phosphatidylglycerol:prolipoprotein diacylglycerol transferase
LHPVLFHLGQIAFPADGILVAAGLLSGLQLSGAMAPRLQLASDRIWNLGLLCLFTLFVGERLLVGVVNLQDFLAHPLWMLGLRSVRDPRYFYAAAVIAICASVCYIFAWRLPWLRVMDCMAPGAGVALGFASLGALAGGMDYGRVTTAHWGVVYTSRIAARNAGTPLGVSLVPVALYAALLQAALAGCALYLLLRESRPGVTAGFWLLASGLGTVLLEQLRYARADEVLAGGMFTPAQTVGVGAVLLGSAMWLHEPRSYRAGRGELGLTKE